MEQDEIGFGDFSDVIISLIQKKIRDNLFHLHRQFKMPVSSKYLVNFRGDETFKRDASANRDIPHRLQLVVLKF